MVFPSALVLTGKSWSCLCKYKSYSNSQCMHFWYGKYPMLYNNYNHTIIFSMITQRFTLKTEIACSFSRNTRINVFILYYIEIPALYSPDFLIRTKSIEVFHSHKQILQKQIVLVKLCSLKVCKNYFCQNIKSTGFSNPQNFLWIQIPV